MSHREVKRWSGISPVTQEGQVVLKKGMRWSGRACVDQDGQVLIRNVTCWSGGHELVRKVLCCSGMSLVAQEGHVWLRKVTCCSGKSGKSRAAQESVTQKCHRWTREWLRPSKGDDFSPLRHQCNSRTAAALESSEIYKKRDENFVWVLLPVKYR